MKKGFVFISIIMIILLSGCSSTINLDDLQEFTVDYQMELVVDGRNRSCDVVGSQATCYDTDAQEPVLDFELDLSNFEDIHLDYFIYYFSYLVLEEDFLNDDYTELRQDKVDDFLLKMTDDEETQQELLEELDDTKVEYLFEFTNDKLTSFEAIIDDETMATSTITYD